VDIAQSTFVHETCDKCTYYSAMLRFLNIAHTHVSCNYIARQVRLWRKYYFAIQY